MLCVLVLRYLCRWTWCWYFLSLPNTGILTAIASFLRVGDVQGSTILLLALSVVIGQFFLVLLSLIALRSVAPGLTRMLLRPFVDGCIAAVAGGAAAYVTLALEGGIAPLTTLAAVFTQGLVAGIIGLAASALALFLVENEEFRTVVSALRRLIHRRSDHLSEVLTPSVEEPLQP